MPAVPRILIITAVAAEAESIGEVDRHTVVVESGVGRTNAACATTQALIELGRFEAVVSAGVGGALPGNGDAPALGQSVVASRCVYMEEGMATPDGFEDTASMGFPLGSFEGNAVPVDADLLERLSSAFRTGCIATVATCSGSDDAAAGVAARTGAVVEAMEGAAVVHAARRLHAPAIEIRTVSNTTGDRSRQQWNLELALASLGRAVREAVDLIRS